MNNQITREMEEQAHEDRKKGQEARMVLESGIWEELDKRIREYVYDRSIELSEDKDALHQLAMFAKAHEMYRSLLMKAKDDGMVAKTLLDAIIDGN